MCALSDHQPANHQEIERLNVGEITEGITVNTVNRKEHCAQAIISELEDRRTHLNSTESDTEMYIARRELFQSLKMHAHREPAENRTRW